MSNQQDDADGASMQLVWDLPLRLTHWLLVISVAGSWISHYAGARWFGVHRVCGYAVLVLVVFRVAWGYTGTLHARFASFVRGPRAVIEFFRSGLREDHPGHNPIGGWSVVAMLGALAVQATSGLFANDEISSAGPLYGWISHAASNRWTWLHRLNSDLVLVLISMHLIAVAWYVGVRRKPLVRAMVTGFRPVHPGRLSPIGRPRWICTALIVLAVCGALAYAVSKAPEADFVLF